MDKYEQNNQSQAVERTGKQNEGDSGLKDVCPQAENPASAADMLQRKLIVLPSLRDSVTIDVIVVV